METHLLDSYFQTTQLLRMSAVQSRASCFLRHLGATVLQLTLRWSMTTMETNELEPTPTLLTFSGSSTPESLLKVEELLTSDLM